PQTQVKRVFCPTGHPHGVVGGWLLCWGLSWEVAFGGGVCLLLSFVPRSWGGFWAGGGRGGGWGCCGCGDLMCCLCGGWGWGRGGSEGSFDFRIAIESDDTAQCLVSERGHRRTAAHAARSRGHNGMLTHT